MGSSSPETGRPNQLLRVEYVTTIHSRPTADHDGTAARPAVVFLPETQWETKSMKKQNGFTLIELLVAIVILGILMSLAVPSFVRTLRSMTVSSTINGMMSDLRYARSEAVRRGTTVVVCRSDDPEAASPICATGAGTSGWASGWIVFLDVAGSGTKTAGDTNVVLKIHESPAGSTKFSFASTGRLNGLAGTTTVIFGGPTNFASDIQRVLCITATGHSRIAGNGSTTCS
jgi:type IV fimbrial biogenesis protein FimT